ncbi:Protein of unknown function [Pyronema omphalodes CBS 100304]|uniref:Uncharacterized protein n=1 Tax=Pyronema omphalodes (strain CBS 100304) TaxID=1076935 RepID=U4L1Q9_PYROM|nr:Protein of unknown function [Pyronema omphalodes CBS 100304]
MSRFQQLN